MIQSNDLWTDVNVDDTSEISSKTGHGDHTKRNMDVLSDYGRIFKTQFQIYKSQ